MTVFKWYDRVETILALTALAGVVVAVFVAGIARTLGVPFAAAPQYAQLCLIWACMMGADIALRQGEHIRVSAIADMMPTSVRKLLSLVCLALILPLLGFIAWKGWHLALGNWERELGASGLSYGLVTLALPVGAILLAISTFRRLFDTGLPAFFEPNAIVEKNNRANTHHNTDEFL